MAAHLEHNKISSVREAHASEQCCIFSHNLRMSLRSAVSTFLTGERVQEYIESARQRGKRVYFIGVFSEFEPPRREPEKQTPSWFTLFISALLILVCAIVLSEVYEEISATVLEFVYFSWESLLHLTQQPQHPPQQRATG